MKILSQSNKFKACKIKDGKVVENSLMMFDIHIVNNNENYIHIAAHFIYKKVEKHTAVNYLWTGEAGRIIIQRTHQKINKSIKIWEQCPEDTKKGYFCITKSLKGQP